MRVWLVRLVLAGMVLAGLLAPSLVRGGDRAVAARPLPTFADGAWSLSYVADVQISGPFPGGTQGTGRGVVTGTGSFEVAGGGISGTHSAAGTAASTITVPGGQSGVATLNLTVEGPIAGTADHAVLQGDVRVSGSVSVSQAGFTTSVPVDFDGALSDGDGAPLSTFSVGCDRISGSWTVDLRGSGEAPASGPSVAGPATFVAIRAPQLSDSAPAYARQVSQLLADTDVYVERIGAAPLDTGALDAIVSRSESISSSLPVVDACADAARPRTPEYGAVLGAEVARLLAAARAGLAHVSTPDLVYLLTLGYRTAAIGTGSTWSGSAPLERALRNELDRRGTVAGATHDTATATLVAVARRQFGVVKPATGPARPARALRGVATIPLSTPTRGRGARPALSWAPVAGSAGYRVVLLDATRRPYWAWQGDTTSVVVGATAKPMPAAAGGPRVTRGSTWTVIAVDGGGRPIALSGARAINP